MTEKRNNKKLNAAAQHLRLTDGCYYVYWATTPLAAASLFPSPGLRLIFSQPELDRPRSIFILVLWVTCHGH